MPDVRGFTLVELLVVVSIIAVLVTMLVPNLQLANELANRTVCMSNLSGAGKGAVLYKSDHDGKWPWIAGTVGWADTPTGTRRDRDPGGADDGDARCVTSLVFLLVREGQPVNLFVCPSDREAAKDPNIYNYDDPCSVQEYYWDFSGSQNVSYSWQAPVTRDGGKSFSIGIDDDDRDVAVMGDKTPAFTDPAWRPDDLTADLSAFQVRRNMSANHSEGRKVNLLMIGLNVQQVDRPDVGARRDNIYTASGSRQRGSRSSTSLDISQHRSTSDTFLIGPVDETAR